MFAVLDTLVDNLWWFLGLLAVAYALRQFRMYVLRRKEAREKEAGRSQALIADGGYEFVEVSPAPETPPAPPTIEEMYQNARRAREAKRASRDRSERVLQEANQLAQRTAVEQNAAVYLTIYDPATLKDGDPPCLVEVKDVGKAGGGHVCVTDHRPIGPCQEDDTEEQCRKRHVAAWTGGLDNVTLTAELERYERHRRKLAVKAAEDGVAYREAHAEIEKFVRDEMVPKYLELIAADAAERECDLLDAVDEFVRDSVERIKREVRRKLGDDLRTNLIRPGRYGYPSDPPPENAGVTN